jgi:hypothetical protein
VLGYVKAGGKRIKFVSAKDKAGKKGRPRIYTHDVFWSLKKYG